VRKKGQLDRFWVALLGGAAGTALVMAGFGLVLTPGVALIWAAAGLFPWVCFALLRPKLLLAHRLGGWIRAVVAVVSAIGLWRWRG
jgi:hypothetical protein